MLAAVLLAVAIAVEVTATALLPRSQGFTAPGWSAVVLAVLWGIIAAVLASVGRKQLNAIKGMPQTAETLQEIPPTLKPSH